jgi:hypothetical protein
MTAIQIELGIKPEATTCEGCDYYKIFSMFENRPSTCELYGFRVIDNTRFSFCIAAQKLAETQADELKRAKELLIPLKLCVNGMQKGTIESLIARFAQSGVLTEVIIESHPRGVDVAWSNELYLIPRRVKC